MITFYVKGDLSNARKFLENLNVFILAESLGAGAWMRMRVCLTCDGAEGRREVFIVV